MPESLRERIKRHERLRLEPYRDSLGNWTVGYGHRLLTSITGVRAELLLTDDLERAEQAAQIVVGDAVSDVRVTMYSLKCVSSSERTVSVVSPRCSRR